MTGETNVFLRRCAECKAVYGCKTKNISIDCSSGSNIGRCVIENRLNLASTYGLCPSCAEKNLKKRNQQKNKNTPV